MYSSIYTHGLGPHDEEKNEEKMPLFRRGLNNLKQTLRHPHAVPSALILISMLSFAANIAFGYLSFVKAGYEPVVSEALTSFQPELSNIDTEEPYEPPNFTPSVHFKAIDNLPTLKLSAQSYVVADAETGEVILESEADKVYPIASVTKFLTAIVSRENIDANHLAVVSKNSFNTYGSEGGLASGEKIKVSDLYYPLLIESSNDAAEVLADDFGREEFLRLLNAKAGLLQMTSTSFSDPSGLSPLNVSSAHDLTKLALYIYKDYQDLLDITRVKQYSILGHTWVNKNLFLAYPNFIGGKNGFINEAKKTTVSYFKVFFRGIEKDSKAIDRPIVVVLLRSNERDRDTALLLAYVARNIKYIPDNIDNNDSKI